MSYPTSEEKQLIKKFRCNVIDILKPGEDHSDQFLIRWIRACEGNLDKAEAIIRKSFKWREQVGADECTNSPVDPFLIKHYPFKISGMDTLGHPVLEIPLGKWDMRIAIEAGRGNDLLTHIVQMYEMTMAKIRESNDGKQFWESHNTQFTSVIDWTGYSYTKLTQWLGNKAVFRLDYIFDAHYPETLYKSFYINCPRMFLFYALLKPILRDRTLRKVKFYGKSREEWEPKLKRLIHTDELSISCGGTNSTTGATPPSTSMQNLLSYQICLSCGKNYSCDCDHVLNLDLSV